MLHWKALAADWLIDGLGKCVPVLISDLVNRHAASHREHRGVMQMLMSSQKMPDILSRGMLRLSLTPCADWTMMYSIKKQDCRAYVACISKGRINWHTPAGRCASAQRSEPQYLNNRSVR